MTQNFKNFFFLVFGSFLEKRFVEKESLTGLPNIENWFGCYVHISEGEFKEHPPKKGKKKERNLRTSASIDHHAGQIAVNNIKFVVKVEHWNGWHFARGATRSGRAGRIGLLHDMRVRIFLQKDVRTFAWTIIRLVLFRRDDPIPSEFDEIHRQWIAAASRLRRSFVAIQTDCPFGPVFAAVSRHHLDEWHLHKPDSNTKMDKLLHKKPNDVINERTNAPSALRWSLTMNGTDLLALLLADEAGGGGVAAAAGPLVVKVGGGTCWSPLTAWTTKPRLSSGQRNQSATTFRTSNETQPPLWWFTWSGWLACLTPADAGTLSTSCKSGGNATRVMRTGFKTGDSPSGTRTTL